jgi:DNA polymerase sigma
MNYIDNIYPFGSIIQFTQNKSSDLEITLITKNYQTINQEEKQNIINLIETHIKNNENYIDTNIIPTNRTTLIKCQDKKTNIKIEANMNNFFGIYNGNLIRNYLLIDSRALILVNTIKDWSKRKKINSNHEGYLSSYCFTLMTIYFLQRIDKPILPVISSKNDLIKTTIENKEYYLEKKLISKDIIKYKSENNDSIATLFIKWLIFYLYLFKEEYYCIDITRKKQLFRSNYMRYMNHYKENNVSRTSVYIFIDMFDYKYNPGAYFKNETSQHDTYKSKLINTLNQLLNGDERFIFEEDN